MAAGEIYLYAASPHTLRVRSELDVEKDIVGQDNTTTSEPIGSIWISGDWFHWSEGDGTGKRNIGSVTGGFGTIGEIWVERLATTDYLYYNDHDGTTRRITLT